MKDKEIIEELNKLSDQEKEKITDVLENDLTLNLPNGNTITFTPEQTQGIIKMREWLKSSNQFFTLAGYSGTGKSTLIKKIIDEFRGRLCVSAPTHKAKKVISSTTGIEGETLHSILGLRPDVSLDEFSPNFPIFNPIAPPRMGDYNLIIIDEASMINEDLFKLIKEEASKWSKIKILFMGDIAQIPPVGEKKSVVFNSDIGELHQLTKVMRQKDGNPLFSIYDVLRNNLNTNYGGFERKTEINSKGEGVYYLNDKREFRKKIIEAFDSKEFRNDIEYAKVIAWRNEIVMQSNKIIRDSIFGKKANIVEVGDVLMAYRSVRSGKQFYNILDNSADYKVERVSKLHDNEYDLKGYTVKISEKEPNGKYVGRNVFIIDHTDHENLHNYAEIHDGLKLMAKEDKKLWKKYYEFRRKSLIMCNITNFRDKSSRMHGDTIVKDLDYGYALTCHKVQGSTYMHVFVLENDIYLNKKIKERNQILYVALSRPTTTATILSELI